MTQKEKILKHLRNNQDITPMVALQWYGIFRLSAIIHKLREEGHLIETAIIPVNTRNGEKHVAKYYLKEK